MEIKTTFNADHYFHIGYPHLTGGKPCQDYALSGIHGDIAYAIVSDGCSTGGNTDVGSRLVALSSVAAIKKFSVPKEITTAQNAMLVQEKEMLGLSVTDLYATCVYARLSEDGGYVAVHGDGVVVFKYLSGEMEIIRYDWADNAPYYPAYAAFAMAEGSNMEALLLTEERHTYDERGRFSHVEKRQLSLREGVEGIVLPLSREKISELSFVAVFSDGVGQIEETELGEAIEGFMSYKKTCGEFVKRRMINAVKEMQKDGKRLCDDIAGAVIHIEHAIKEEESS